MQNLLNFLDIWKIWYSGALSKKNPITTNFLNNKGRRTNDFVIFFPCTVTGSFTVVQWASGYARVNYDPYQIPTVTSDSHFAHVTGEGGGGLTSPSVHADYT